MPDRGRDRPRRRDRDARGRAARGVRGRLGADAARRRADRARRAPSARCARSPAGSMRVAKERDVAVVLVGHVTKEGALAGPRVLEHLVDCVLQFEGERERTYRTLRALKNRFGSTNEVGRVRDARRAAWSRCWTPRRASSRRPPARPGSVVLARWRARGRCSSRCRRWSRPSELVPPRRVVHGDRPQPPGARAGGAGPPRGRRSSARPTSSSTWSGGVRVDEPGADLAVALAVASAARGAPLGGGRRRPLRRPASASSGLTGELRPVAHPERRARRGGEVRARAGARHPERRWHGGPLRDAARAARAAAPARARRGACGLQPPGSCEHRNRPVTEPPEKPRLLELRSMAAAIRGRAPRARSRQEPRLVKALEMVAPGTALREGIDNILHARTGGLHRDRRPRRARASCSPAASSSTSTTRRPCSTRWRRWTAAIVLNANATKIALGQRPADAGPDDPLAGDRHPPPHRRARVQADRRARDRDLPAPRGRLALRRRRQVHPRGHPRRAGQGQPGAGDARQVPHAASTRSPPASPPWSSRAARRCTTSSRCSSAPSS